jgi:hypothetical protein
MSAEAMAESLGIERESVYRLEREAYTRLNPDEQQHLVSPFSPSDSDL